MSCASILNILDFSDEILLKIMCHLSAGGRASLGNTCTKFYRLAFGEKQFFRNLDFSEDGYLTSSSEVQQYFKDATMCQHVRTINLGSIYCSSSEPMLQDFKKAVNLVELNIMGIKFANFPDFGSLLDPLENLRKLSAGWPESPNLWKLATMAKTLNRLKYLTVRVNNSEVLDTLIPVLLRYSQQLEALFVLVVSSSSLPYNVVTIDEALEQLELFQLPNLKIAAGYNMDSHYLPLDEILRHILPDRERWTQFYADSREIYYEKDAEVPSEMSSHVHITTHPAINRDEPPTKCLMPGRVLADMIEKATGVDSRNYYLRAYADDVSLKIEDIKLLLEDPSHQITYLHIDHDLQPTCTEYLSAFPYLTKLVLGGDIKSEEGKGVSGDSEDPNKEVTANLSFAKLVKNTPHMKDFTVYSKNSNECVWDLNALYLISGWKELTTLSLAGIPIENGKFLIEIGKHCEHLEELRLRYVGSYFDCCYKNELKQMLTHCRNLKDFAIEQNNLGRVSDMFTMFGGNRKLRRFHMITYGENSTFDNLVPATEQFIRSHHLILFACEFKDLGEDAHVDLESKLQRLKIELGRTSFEFEIVDSRDMGGDVEYTERNHSLEFAHKDLILPFSISDALYQLGC